jgi:hypothetical protein
MSKLAVDALSRWIAEWVRPVHEDAIAKEAERLAAEFTAYAADAGIDIGRLEEDIGEDLTSFMEDALAEAAESAPAPGRDVPPGG